MSPWVSNHNISRCDAWGLCKLPKIIDIFLKCLKDKPFQLQKIHKKKNRITLVNLNIHSKRPRECSHKKCNSFFPFLHLCASTHGRCKANHIRLPQSKWCNQRDVAVQFLLSWLLFWSSTNPLKSMFQVVGHCYLKSPILSWKFPREVSWYAAARPVVIEVIQQWQCFTPKCLRTWKLANK